MDSNHPIPQDVTGFQFRLIGDMTVKQFAYVAVGGILTIVFLYAPIPFLLRIPFMILAGGAGAALAFMPIEGRPLDVMVGYFLKALFLPNQYAYHKNGGHLPIFAYQAKPQVVPSLTSAKPQVRTVEKTIDKEKKLESYLQFHHAQNLSPLEKREVEFMQKLFPQSQPVQTAKAPMIKSFTPDSPVMPPVSGQPAGTTTTSQTPPKEGKTEEVPKPKIAEEKPKDATPEDKNVNLSLQENVLSQELNHAKEEEAIETDTAKKQEVHTHVTELETQLLEVQRQKERLEKELSLLKAQVSETSQKAQTLPAVSQPAPMHPQAQVPQPQGQQAAVRKIPAEMAKNLGLPHLPDVPNLILGIVKDPRGNVLTNILVEVKDKDGTPARAFRTNQLGQFASATPLSNGTYAIEFEDPKGEHRFDTIEITANGEILMPIEVISQDAREELRKALFN